MTKKLHSTRRDFLGKVSVLPIGLALAGLPSQRLFSQTTISNNSLESNQLIMSDINEKKFVPVMVTPFTEQGKIDYKTVSALIDFYIAAGVKGFFANCLSSEMYALTPEERLSLTRHVVKHVNGRMPVVATGSFGETTKERAEFAKEIYHTGINAVILITSHFAKKEESDEIMLANFHEFFDLTDNIPMGTYECPAPYKRILTPEAFTSLLETNRLVYHKDTSLDFPLVKAKLDLIKGNRIEFYDAHTPNTMNALQHGAKGMSAIAGNFYPEIFVWMCNHANDPKLQKEVAWLQAELTKADSIISASYPMSSKYFLHKRGLNILPVSRTSPSPLTDQQMQTLDGVHATFMGWCDRLGIKAV